MLAAVVAALRFSAVLSVLYTFSWFCFCSVVVSLFVLGWCAGEWFFRGLAGRLDLFLRPAGAERTPTAFLEFVVFFVWIAGLVAMTRRVAVCLQGTAELLSCWTGSGAPCPLGAEPSAAGAAGRSCLRHNQCMHCSRLRC